MLPWTGNDEGSWKWHYVPKQDHEDLEARSIQLLRRNHLGIFPKVSNYFFRSSRLSTYRLSSVHLLFWGGRSAPSRWLHWREWAPAPPRSTHWAPSHTERSTSCTEVQLHTADPQTPSYSSPACGQNHTRKARPNKTYSKMRDLCQLWGLKRRKLLIFCIC